MQIACKIIILFSLFGILKAYDIDFIKSKPKGIARDFYIYEYLQSNDKIDANYALELYDLIDNKSSKIINLFKNQIPTFMLPKAIYCKELPYDELIKNDDECLNLGFKLNYVLNNKISDDILLRLNDARISNQIQILHSKKILDSLLSASGDDFRIIYFGLSKKDEIFNQNSRNFKLMSNKNYGKAIYHLVISQKYPKFTKALLKEDITGVNDWTFFALGLNELKNGHFTKAKKYFFEVSKSENTFLRDRANFWQYKITSNISFLKKLANSYDFNLYSLYAVKKLKLTPKYDIISIDDNIFSKLNDSKSPFDIQNPFEWQILNQNILLVKNKESLLDITKLFYYKDTIPYLVFILNKYYNFSKKFFITPYSDELDFDIATKTIVYSVAKQESKFIPSAISRSYALGMMQIMPFNIPAFAKELGLSSDIKKDSMFNPVIALQFGAYYLNHLKKEFKHPLFISYAYNGGPTFIRNHLKNNQVFSKNNKFDPWLSMEFIPYEESRFYGMKIIANYIVYNDLEGNNINIDSFLNRTLR